ncbi:MAG: N-formylglutamate amidohydrolase [Candidatus Syntrophosphaera sp.]|nr:N-formylglutamate amidohydrolase [Candidatus Syntrophosphaera sp.]
MLHSVWSFSNETIPVLATAIHNGHQMPQVLLASCGINEADRLREEDPHTGDFAGMFPNHVVLQTSRFAVDLNRKPEQAVYLKPEDCWGLPVRSQPVPDALLSRLREDYASWYSLLKYQVERLLAIHPFLVVLDLHSYNHRRGGPEAEPDPQIQNPDIIIGRSNLKERHHPAADALQHLLDGQPLLGKALDCRLDIKFSGGHLSRWLNDNYLDRLICLAIEFKKTWMDEWSGKIDDQAFFSLKSLFLAAVRDWLADTYHIFL